jgi:hypothetical protein
LFPLQVPEQHVELNPYEVTWVVGSVQPKPQLPLVTALVSAASGESPSLPPAAEQPIAMLEPSASAAKIRFRAM